jgi:outer membrane murein-binding lipoprotein Lpp
MKSFAIVIAALVLTGCAQVSGGYAQKAHQTKVQAALSDYERARQRGDGLDMCVKAKMVAIAYGDARDGLNASAWYARERDDCRAALAAYNIRPPGGSEVGED